MEIKLAGRCGVGPLHSVTVRKFHHHLLAICGKGTGVCSLNLNPLLFVSHLAFLYVDSGGASSRAGNNPPHQGPLISTVPALPSASRSFTVLILFGANLAIGRSTQDRAAGEMNRLLAIARRKRASQGALFLKPRTVRYVLARKRDAVRENCDTSQALCSFRHLRNTPDHRLRGAERCFKMWCG
jgi:hypothetical protein